MPADRLTRKALEVGRAEAREVLDLRSAALRSRNRAARAVRARTRARPAAAPAAASAEPARMRAAGDPATAGVLVAEGDSWFDYPLNDVLRMLEDNHAYDVESVAHKGDRVEDMAYGRGQLEELTRRLEKLLRRGVVPKAILLSGGGNDVAGDEFAVLLNHTRSAIRGLNEQVVAGVIDERVKFAYLTILSAVTAVCEDRIGRPLPILVHGYDYPVPDGRGFLGGLLLLPGPWLEPGFRAKGFDDLPERIELAKELIDRFNARVKGVAAMPEFPHVKYVDIRGTLSVGPDYKKWWANELHPTKRGFERVTDRFAAALATLP
jgi:lysophospholipase L1-like esterase